MLKLLKRLTRKVTLEPLAPGVYVYWNEPNGLPNLRYFTDRKSLGDHVYTLHTRGIDYHVQEAA